MLVKEYRNLLLESLLDFLWKQWSQLGISAHISKNTPRYVIDPEALLVFSAFIGRYDQRLYDLILDWLNINGHFVSIQRLKTFIATARPDTVRSLQYMSYCAGQGGEKRWLKLSEADNQDNAKALEPLFLSKSTEQKIFIPQKDINAKLFGWSRNIYKPSNKVQQFSNDTPGTLLLRLRGTFGLSARAETILTLLEHNICKVQEIANHSHFAWKSIQDVLDELSASAIVDCISSSTRGSKYKLKTPHVILTLFNIPKVIFPDWINLFDALTNLWTTVANPQLESFSEDTWHEEIRLLFENKIYDAFASSSIEPLQEITAKNIEKLPELLAAV